MNIKCTKILSMYIDQALLLLVYLKKKHQIKFSIIYNMKSFKIKKWLKGDVQDFCKMLTSLARMYCFTSAYQGNAAFIYAK